MVRVGESGVEASPYTAHGKLNVTFTEDLEPVRRAGERAGCRTVRLGSEDFLLGDELDRIADWCGGGEARDIIVGVMKQRAREFMALVQEKR
jgi:hypothetical protein